MGDGLKGYESAENYLETILILSKSGAPIRSIDIVNELAYSKPSVSIAMKNLRADGHILMDADGYITLTESGKAIAKTMYERHTLLSDWLTRLGVERDMAVQDACRMEHDMSEQSFAAIKAHIEEWEG